MTYENLCRYIFRAEGFPDFEGVRLLKSRKREIRATRQLCMYLGDIIIPNLSLATLGAPFGQDHATVIHAKKTVVNDCVTNKDLKLKVAGYLKDLGKMRVSDQLADIEQAAKDEMIMKQFMSVLLDMELVAKAYCMITNKQLINKP